LTEDEARHSLEFKDYFIIEPEFHWWTDKNIYKGKRLSDGFRYTSDKNDQWLTKEELRTMIKTQ
jgi:UDP-N-acetylglucosamine 4,6-dehydratase